MSTVQPFSVSPMHPLGSAPPEPYLHASARLDLRRALSSGEVAALLARLPQQSDERPWQVYAPRLALGMGLTGPQIAQLDTRQLVMRDNRVWLVLPDSKQGAAPRAVPLHRTLEGMGFCSFAHSRYFANGRESSLFPDLADANRPGDAIESWLRRATRGLKEEGHHAPTLADLRATCARAALKGGASVEAVEALMGWPVQAWDDPREDEEAKTLLRDARHREAVDAVALPPPLPARSHPAPVAIQRIERPLLSRASWLG